MNAFRMWVWFCAAASVCVLNASASADTMPPGRSSLEMVTVGNPGNTADSAAHSGNPAGQGSVSYIYQIGKYEVTAGQYCEFLNKVAGVDTYALYNVNMSQTDCGSGIARSGGGTVESPYMYSVAATFVNRPVNYVSYWDACRFANWLHNGQQGAGTTETGAYTLNGYNSEDGRTIQRNPGWKWAVTSEDEWYKAAYYKGGSTNAGYWDYPTRSDTAPGSDMADASGNNANYWTDSSPYPLDPPYSTTVVGEFQNSPSPYGTFDQGGNVEEWNESIVYQESASSSRGLRGESFFMAGGAYPSLRASRRVGNSPSFGDLMFGFRVSEVPEPATLGLMALGALAALRCKRA